MSQDKDKTEYTPICVAGNGQMVVMIDKNNLVLLESMNALTAESALVFLADGTEALTGLIETLEHIKEHAVAQDSENSKSVLDPDLAKMLNLKNKTLH